MRIRPSRAPYLARLRRGLAAFFLAAWAFLPVPLFAQNAECDRLQATIASLPRGESGGGDRYVRAAGKQRGEIERTVAYAHSLGCDKRGIFNFGDEPPAQCGGLNAQIQRMRANLAQLESQAGAAGGGGAESRRRALMTRYNANCGQVAAPPQVAQRPRERGFFETLFGGGGAEPRAQPQQQAVLPPQPAIQRLPLDDNAQETTGGEGTPGYARGGNVAVCVRTCDGGFFPLSYNAGRYDSSDLSDLCTALCPNAAAAVYTHGGGADIETAVSVDGEPYRALPNALRYRTTYDPSCTCKAANQTWVAALADAERLIANGNRHDLVVTEQKAAELSRPKITQTPLKPLVQAVKSVTAEPRADPLATVPPGPDGATAKEASSAASVATASQETTGISAGDGAGAAVVTRDQGVTQDVIGPGGVKRRVRIIGLKP